jgi:GNAT superfamily N-acetyltransferase
MTDHPDQLFAIPFQQTDQARLEAFNCGSEPWARAASEWIRGSEVLTSMEKHQTKVWLFENSAGTLVGFGSLGPTRRRWPPPDGDYLQLLLIPMVAIERAMHGKPDDPEWRYSHQIMSHLIAEAGHWRASSEHSPASRPSWLLLMVHPENHRAMKLYMRFGFELIEHASHHGHHLMKLWIGD